LTVGRPAHVERDLSYAERRWRTADGIDLHIRDYPGAGGPARLPVICLHGLTRNSKDFAAIAGEIAGAGRRVIVPEMRGRGRSGYDPQPMNYVPKTYARDVAGMMRALGVERAIFLGTSMGGIITMLMAATHSRRVAGAILNDVGPEVAPEGLARIAAYAGKPAQIGSWDEATAYVRRIGAAAFPHFGDADWQRFAHLTFRTTDSGTPAFDYDPAIAEPMRAGKLKAPPLLTWFLFRRLARRRPLLLLRGERSDILSPAVAGRMRRIAKHILYAEIPGVGHAPMLDEPAARQAIAAFLAEVP
jgi:pimeloyl-ACP methyl ester carboxylesterase